MTTEFTTTREAYAEAIKRNAVDPARRRATSLHGYVLISHGPWTYEQIKAAYLRGEAAITPDRHRKPSSWRYTGVDSAKILREAARKS